jgi:FemAB-related protein (PEP-CTERM system-associated)
MANDISANRIDVAVSLGQTEDFAQLRRFVATLGLASFHSDPRWPLALAESARHRHYILTAMQGGLYVGVLPLVFVRSALFGKFLVSLPYLDTAGVAAVNDMVAARLIDRAVQLADELDVQHLQLRHERRCLHPALAYETTSKAQMRLDLHLGSDAVWAQLKTEVRTQIRKAQKRELQVLWGNSELLDDFYEVFSENMRDLGTPVYGCKHFEIIMRRFPDETEFCVVRLGNRTIAAALAVHGPGITEAPSVSSLRAFRPLAANSLLYWHLIQRAIERGQGVFDFGRSTPGSNTYVFKKKWGAQPVSTVWQYYVRKGNPSEMRPEGGRFNLAIKLWRCLPVGLTRRLGPLIVRGIP